MYPTIVAILVNQERSLVETFGFSTVLKANGENLPAYSATGRPATRGHLSFASFPSRGPTSRLSSARPSSISSVRPVGVEHMEVGRGDFDSYRGLARGSPSWGGSRIHSHSWGVDSLWIGYLEYLTVNSVILKCPYKPFSDPQRFITLIFRSNKNKNKHAVISLVLFGYQWR